MTGISRRFVLSAWLVAMMAAVAFAQPAATPSGHWEGAIQVPGQELKIEIDLAPKDDKWEGTIAIPAQGVKNLPLEAITVQGDSVSFVLSGAPGKPQFNGTLAKDGKSVSGQFTQGGGAVPFAVTRTGDAKFEPIPATTPVGKEIAGTWEGSLDAGGTTLRLVVKLANGADGKATGTLVSLDQGGIELPLVAIVQTGAHLKFLVRAVAGTFEGDLKDGQLSGTWAQGPGSLPLVLKRQP